MKKTIVTVLLIIVVVLLVAVSAVLGYFWYQENHIFVEGVAYSIHETQLDLREKPISMAHYDALHAQLPQCQVLWNVPFQGDALPNDTREIRVEKLTAEDVQLLQTYLPELEKIDASGCSDYDLLEQVQNDHPNWKIIYQVDIGGTVWDPDTTALELEKGQYTPEALTANLVHLPQVKNILLHMPEMTLEEIEAFKAAFPEVEITNTVELFGKELGTDTTELDLSKVSSGDLDELVEKLPMLPGITKLELMDGETSSVTKEDVKKLMDALPGAQIHYTFELFGQSVSTETEELSFKNEKLGDDYEQELRQALDIMPKCSRIVLDNCHFSDEVLAKIREDYRGRTKIVWRVWFGDGGSSLTDATAIRAVYGLFDSNCKDLIYCEDVVYMDLGHNEYLNDSEFISGMPNLEYLIISGSQIRTLEHFRNCKKLKLLELAFCGYIDDVSPLADCESLEMLNISNTKVTDLSALDDLKLTHMTALAWETKDWVPGDAKDHFKEKHPDCWTQFGSGQPYGDGWRYTGEKPNNRYLPYYQQIRDVFMYDKYPNCPNNVGWYFEEKTVWTNQDNT